MKNKNVIKKVLFEGTHQISAVLPKALSPQKSIETFVYKIPIILNKTHFIERQDEKKIDYFKIIFYKRESFNSDFNSNFYNNTLDFKKFNISPQYELPIGISKNFNNISKSFYQDGNLSNPHYSIDFKDSSIADRELYIYNITLPNSVSKEVMDEDYVCMRIFAIKNNSIVDDTDFVFFESKSFLKDVYDTKMVYDLQYFINEVYLEGFSESLNIRLPNSSSVGDEKLQIIKSTQFDTSVVTGNVSINISLENTVPTTVTIDSMSIFSFKSNSIISVLNDNFFKNIVKLYLLGTEIFAFRIQCVFNVNADIASDNPVNIGVLREFEKQRTFSRSDSFITNIVSTYRESYLNNLLNRCNFNLNVSANSRYIEAILTTDNYLEESELLSLFKVKSIHKNNRAYLDSELYLNSNMSENDKINFIDLNLNELMFNESNSFKFYIPNNTIINFSKIKIRIGNDYFDSIIESETFIVNPDYENLFNKFNKRLSNSIEVISSGLNQNMSSDGFFTYISKIKISNIKRRFEDIAYSFGYFNQQDSQNTSSSSDIVDFFKSSIFSFEIEESMPNINNAIFKKKKFFFGNQIIQNDSIKENSFEFNQEFLSTYLRISIDNIVNGAVIKSNSSSNTVRAIRNINFTDTDSITTDILDFLIDNNFYIRKKIKIKVIPIPKLIKLYQKQADLDKNLNIIYEEDVSDNIKNSININFVDLFYDKNSSLNWDRFLMFKKLYFKKNKNASEIMDSADYLSPIWDYLSSSIYIDDQNAFIKKENYSENDIRELIFNKNLESSNFRNIEKNETNSEDIFQLSSILTRSFFEGISDKYFNFQINNNDIINIENTGMAVNFKKFDKFFTKPRLIEFVNTNENKERRVDFDLTGLKKYFSNQEILRMNFLVKLSLHPMITNQYFQKIPNIELTNFKNTSLGTKQKFYITQNNNYMKGNLSKYFFEYCNSLNKLNSKIYEDGDSLKMSIFLGNNREKISTSTFKELFDFCTNNNSITLNDFYLRVGFSFEINNKYYYANIYKKIDRINSIDSIIEINRVESIKEI